MSQSYYPFMSRQKPASSSSSSSSSSKPPPSSSSIMKRLEYSCEHEWSLSKRVANICIFVTGIVVVAVAAVYVYSAYTDTSEEDDDEDEQPVWIRRVMIGVGAAEIVVLIFVIREYLSKLWKGESKPEMKTPKPA